MNKPYTPRDLDHTDVTYYEADLGVVRAALIDAKLANPYEHTLTPGLPYGSTMVMWLEGRGGPALSDDHSVWVAESIALRRPVAWAAKHERKTSVYVTPAYRHAGIATTLIRMRDAMSNLKVCLVGSAQARDAVVRHLNAKAQWVLAIGADHHPLYYRKKSPSDPPRDVAWLVTLNPGVLDFLWFEDAQEVAERLHHVLRDGTPKPVSVDDAERFWAAYNVGIQHVSEVLMTLGLWLPDDDDATPPPLI